MSSSKFNTMIGFLFIFSAGAAMAAAPKYKVNGSNNVKDGVCELVLNTQYLLGGDIYTNILKRSSHFSPEQYRCFLEKSFVENEILVNEELVKVGTAIKSKTNVDQQLQKIEREYDRIKFDKKLNFPYHYQNFIFVSPLPAPQSNTKPEQDKLYSSLVIEIPQNDLVDELVVLLPALPPKIASNKGSKYSGVDLIVHFYQKYSKDNYLKPRNNSTQQNRLIADLFLPQYFGVVSPDSVARLNKSLVQILALFFERFGSKILIYDADREERYFGLNTITVNLYFDGKTYGDREKTLLFNGNEIKLCEKKFDAKVDPKRNGKGLNCLE